MYTYLIGWSHLNKWYYGVRFSKKAKPSDLWVSYFTSSNIVKKFRQEHGEPDVIEIRKTFDDPMKARLWEEKVLSKMNVVDDPKWLNMTNNKDKFQFNHTGRKHSPEALEKMRLAHKLRPRKPNLGNTHSDEAKEKMRVKKLGKKQSPEAIEAARVAREHYNTSPEYRERRSQNTAKGWETRRANRRS